MKFKNALSGSWQVVICLNFTLITPSPLASISMLNYCLILSLQDPSSLYFLLFDAAEQGWPWKPLEVKQTLTGLYLKGVGRLEALYLKLEALSFLAESFPS